MAESIITDKAMQSPAEERDRWLIESGARGAGRLIGRITPGGERRFYYRYTDANGERVRLLIGAYDPRGDGRATFTVKQARQQAIEWQALYLGGARNLREHLKQQQTDAEQAAADARRAAELARLQVEEQARTDALERERRISVRQLFERWRDVDLKPQQRTDGTRSGRKDGGKLVEEQFTRHLFPALGDIPAADVTKADAMAILDSLKAAGKLRTCNMLLGDLKQMFAFALQREIVARNPLDTITRRAAGGAETMRERVLSPEEVKELARLVPLAKLNRRTAAGIWILLSTGARIGELTGATWADLGSDLQALAATPGAESVKVGAVDLIARTWHLPTTKNERDHTIHLSDFALRQFEILREQRELLNEPGATALTPWVFPALDNRKPVCVKSLGKQLADRQRDPDKRLKHRSKNTDALVLAGGKWTAHDLRRTAATMMARLGVSGDVIDECLNHVIENRVRRTYIRDRRPAEQVRAFDTLGARLDDIVSGVQPASNVVALKAA